MRYVFALIFCMACFAASNGAKSAARPANPSYPPTPRGNIVEVYYGTSVADPYRWLEASTSQQTKRWVAAENSETERYLADLPLRAKIDTRVAQIDDYDTKLPPEHHGRYWARWVARGVDRQNVLYVSTSPMSIGRELLDPAALPAGETLSSVVRDVFSPNGLYLAYSTVKGDSIWETWHIRDVATGRDLADTLTDCAYSYPAWLPDGSAFYYQRYPSGSERIADWSKRHDGALYLHHVRTPQASDRLVFAGNVHPFFQVGGNTTDDGRYLLIGAWSSAGDRLWAADLHHGFHLTRIYLPADSLPLGNDGPRIYFFTYGGAALGRIVSVDVEHAGLISTLVPEQHDLAKDSTLLGYIGATFSGSQAVSLIGNRFYVTYVHDAHMVVRSFHLDGSPAGSIALPGIGTADAPYTGERSDRYAYYEYTSYATPEETFRYDTLTGKSTLAWKPMLRVSTSSIVTDTVYAWSEGGARVPMFVTHRRGQKLDGSAPTVMWVYGGPWFQTTPIFNGITTQWLEMGGVEVEAYPRGGVEFGEGWHTAAVVTTKQRTFDDVIACAEKLEDDGWTSPSRLALFGASEGGLTVGTVITQRPDLFAAAVADSGLYDMVRGDRLGGGLVPSEFGSADASKAQFEALFSYSPYHHVRDGVHYPAMLLVAGAQDTTVDPAHSLKFAAALQHAQAGSAPILLYEFSGKGHYAELSVGDREAFMMDAFGLKPAVPPSR